MRRRDFCRTTLAAAGALAFRGLMPRMRNGWKGTILEAIEPGDSVYLVHSFAITPTDDADRLADCTYNGRIISAAIQSGNVIGCQFHPEKSGSVGLKILDQFLT